jgi:Putative regulator of cell autolysis
MSTSADGVDPEGKPYRSRTHITDISATGFHYSQDISHDGGATWEEGHLVMDAKRAAGAHQVSDASAAARAHPARSWARALVWLQLGLGWLPVLALYAGLIFTQHQPVTLTRATLLAVRSLLPAALLGILVYRLANRVPWPRPFRLRFVLIHAVAAPTYACVWIIAASILESIIRGRLTIVLGPGLVPFLVLGVWLYVMVAGISYAIAGTERAARAEAASVRMQLGALRAQLHPHFLFNALHTVVQLIPVDPRRAADAAEQVAPCCARRCRRIAISSRLEMSGRSCGSISSSSAYDSAIGCACTRSSPLRSSSSAFHPLRCRRSSRTPCAMVQRHESSQRTSRSRLPRARVP